MLVVVVVVVIVVAALVVTASVSDAVDDARVTTIACDPEDDEAFNW